MKKYSVIFNVLMTVEAVVEAENEQDAKDKALDKDFGELDIMEWEAHMDGCRGNVCYRPNPWEAEVEELEE